MKMFHWQPDSEAAGVGFISRRDRAEEDYFYFFIYIEVGEKWSISAGREKYKRSFLASFAIVIRLCFKTTVNVQEH